MKQIIMTGHQIIREAERLYELAQKAQGEEQGKRIEALNAFEERTWTSGDEE